MSETGKIKITSIDKDANGKELLLNPKDEAIIQKMENKINQLIEYKMLTSMKDFKIDSNNVDQQIDQWIANNAEKEMWSIFIEFHDQLLARDRINIADFLQAVKFDVAGKSYNTQNNSTSTPKGSQDFANQIKQNGTNVISNTKSGDGSEGFGETGKVGNVYGKESAPIVDKNEEKKQSEVKTLPNDMTGYDFSSIFVLKNSKLSDRLAERTSNVSQRRILKLISEGRAITNITDIEGDNSVKAAASAEQNFLKENFALPLIRLTVNEDSFWRKDIGVPLHINNCLHMLNSHFNTEKTSNLKTLDEHVNYWNNNLPRKDMTPNQQKNFRKEMGKISHLYTQYRNHLLGTDKFPYPYSKRVMQMVFGDIENKAGDQWLHSEKLLTWNDVLDSNNDHVGAIDLGDGHQIFDRKSQSNKANNYLYDLEGQNNTHTIQLVNKKNKDKQDTYEVGKLYQKVYRDKDISADSVREFLNDSLRTKDEALGVNAKYALEMHKALKDPNSKPSILLESKAFNANPVEVANLLLVVEHAKLHDNVAGQISDADKFAFLLSDFDGNGRGGSAGDVGTLTGAQFLKNYRDATLQVKYMHKLSEDEAEQRVGNNILHFFADRAALFDPYVSKVLTDHMASGASFEDFIKQHPALVVYMRNLIKQNPYMVQNMLVSGDNIANFKAAEIKAEEQLHVSLAEQTNDLSTLDLSQEQKAEFNKQVQEKSQELYARLSKQIDDVDPEFAIRKEQYRKLDLNSLTQHVASAAMQALVQEPNLKYGLVPGSLALGTAVPLLKDLQLNLGVAQGPGGQVAPTFGLGWKSKNGNTRLNVNMTLFGPSVSISQTLYKWTNAGKVGTIWSRHSVNTGEVSANAHIGVNYISVGVNAVAERDFLQGIKEQYKVYNEMLHKNIPNVMQSVKSEVRKIRQLVTQDNYVDKPEYKVLQNAIKDKLFAHFSAAFASDKNLKPDRLHHFVDHMFKGISLTEYDGSPEADMKLITWLREDWHNAIMELQKRKIDLTGLSVGLNITLSLNLVKTLLSVIPVGVKITSYKGLDSVETNASRELLNYQETTGHKNRMIEDMSLEDRVNFINDSLRYSRSFEGKLLPEQELSVMENGFIKVPKAVWNGNRLNVKVAPTMKGQIVKDEEGNFYLPPNTILRYTSLNDATGSSNILNIGSAYTSQKDLHFLRDRDGFYASNGDKVDMSTFFASSFDQVQAPNEHLITKPDYRRREQELTTKLNPRYPGMTFSVSEQGILITNGQGQRLIAPGTKEFSLGKDVNGFDTKMDYDGQRIVLYSTKDGTSSQSEVSNSEILTYKVNIQQTIDDLSEKISVLEKLEVGSRFRGFLDNMIVSKKELGEIPKYREALNSLIVSEPKNLTQTEKVEWEERKNTINNVLEVQDGDKSVLQLATYLLQTFALEQANRESYQNLANTRKEAFLNIDPNVKSFLNRQMFNDIMNGNSLVPAADYAVNPTILGYTAFYRHPKAVGTEARGYGLTLPGQTRVFGSIVKPFEEYYGKDHEKVKAARNWIIDKTLNDPVATSLIVASLQDRLPQHLRDEVAILGNNPSEFKKLLNGEPVTIDGCTVKLNATPVFYLLGECANESVGLQIQTIHCQIINERTGAIEQEEIIDGHQTTYKPGKMFVNYANTANKTVLHNHASIAGTGAFAVELGTWGDTTDDSSTRTQGGKEGTGKTQGGGEENKGNVNELKNKAEIKDQGVTVQGQADPGQNIDFTRPKPTEGEPINF